MTGGLYTVIGRRGYRGHRPNTVFEAVLDPSAEQRAIARGDIRLDQRVTPQVQPGSFRLPSGWCEQKEEG